MPKKHWISAGELAQKRGISRETASKALARAEAGKPWNGAILNVRWVQGNGGRQRVVEVSSLPPLFKPTKRRVIAYASALRSVSEKISKLASELEDQIGALIQGANNE